MNDRDCENCIHHTKKGCKSWDCKFERKVTRKETIKVFEDMKKGIYPYDPNVYLDIAINSLEIDERYELEYEQIEPCEDAISRQAVLDAIEDDNRNGHYSCFASNNDAQCFKDVICSLPSVNPQEPKWIPVSERLPEDGTYLVTVERIVGELGIDMKSFAKDLNRVDEYDFPKHKCGWYDYDSEYGYWEDTGIIAWMPLPKPYKAESEVQDADSN